MMTSIWSFDLFLTLTFSLVCDLLSIKKNWSIRKYEGRLFCLSLIRNHDYSKRTTKTMRQSRQLALMGDYTTLWWMNAAMRICICYNHLNMLQYLRVQIVQSSLVLSLGCYTLWIVIKWQLLLLEEESWSVIVTTSHIIYSPQVLHC